MRKKSKKKSKRSPRATSSNRDKALGNIQSSASQPMIMLDMKDRGRKDVIASLEQINDHLDHLMKPLNEMVQTKQ